jgi:hypothetical protein
LKNPQTINSLLEIDTIARRYHLNPLDLIGIDTDNKFLRLAYIRKFAEISIDHENQAMEQARNEAQSKR